jgi:Protein of unknown function (DUF4232)
MIRPTIRLWMTALAVLLAAACSSGTEPTAAAPSATGGPTPALSPVPTSPPAGPATDIPAPTGPGQPAGNPERCTTAELTGSLGPGEGAAGSVYRTLLLTNTGGRSCELTGFPGVSYVTGDGGQQVGPAAAMSGERGGPVRLAAGASAGAELKLVNVANYDAAVCRPTPVRGLRVYPPGDTGALFVPAEGTGCAGTPPGDQLSVQTLTAR